MVFISMEVWLAMIVVVIGVALTWRKHLWLLLLSNWFKVLWCEGELRSQRPIETVGRVAKGYINFPMLLVVIWIVPLGWDYDPQNKKDMLWDWPQSILLYIQNLCRYMCIYQYKKGHHTKVNHQIYFIRNVCTQLQVPNTIGKHSLTLYSSILVLVLHFSRFCVC